MPREGYLTASQFAAAVGANPYCSRQKCARLILGLEKEEANDATRRGNEFEWLAVANYEALTGNLVFDQQRWFQLWLTTGNQVKLGCHVDGLTNGGRTVVEVKTPRDPDSFDRNYATVPAYYIPQVQGQMLLAGAEEAHFVANCEDVTRIWRVAADPEHQQRLVQLLDEFWGCIVGNIIPPRAARPKLPEVLIERIH